MKILKRLKDKILDKICGTHTLYFETKDTAILLKKGEQIFKSIEKYHGKDFTNSLLELAFRRAGDREKQLINLAVLKILARKLEAYERTKA